MSLKQFRFTIENTKTRETARFLGQGETVEEAWKDGFKNIQDPFRPSSSGAKRPEHGCAVTLPSGAIVSRTLKEFQGDRPYQPEEAK